MSLFQCHPVQICICHRQKCPGLEDKSFSTPCSLLIQHQPANRTHEPLSSYAFTVAREYTVLCIWAWEETQPAKARRFNRCGQTNGELLKSCRPGSSPSRAGSCWRLMEEDPPKGGPCHQAEQGTTCVHQELLGDCIFLAEDIM